MNRLNTLRKATKKRFTGHWISLHNDFDWIAIAVRCPQFFRPSAFMFAEIVGNAPDGKPYWNGHKGEDE